MGKHYWEDIATGDVDSASSNSVWTAVQLWINRPHLLNRRLSGVAEALRVEAPLDMSQLSQGSSEWSATLSHHLLRLDELLEEQYAILVREMISRTVHYRNEYEALLISKRDDWVVFLPLRIDVLDDDSTMKNGPRKFATASCVYRISWQEEKSAGSPSTQIRISVLLDGGGNERATKSEDWLKEHLLPKLVSWASKPKKVEGSGDAESTDQSSLRLISVKDYTRTLLDLKEKYSRKLIESWTESTDPIKFVSEDLCIAAYLLTLWRSNCSSDKENCSTELPSFVDLGCGNGLLVHILSLEGCRGVGIDVRNRRIWHSFGSGTQLEERTLDPSTDTFPHVDWVIGNHSDELTPWIPYMAARSSYRCRFFLLPCCAFDFNKKFNKPANESQYSAYYKYVHSLCQEFGFQAEQDILRIPSTKKRCFIGRTRHYAEQEQEAQQARNKVFLASRLEDRPSSFVVRDAVEAVRNCSRLPQDTKDQIIHRIKDELLSGPLYMEGANGRWNAGSGLSLAELSGRLDPNLLNAMRSQCGGLQTFIRNHKFIFGIENGYVRLRNYSCDVQRKPLSRTKSRSKPTNVVQSTASKPCFFFHHHPDGCPLASSNCAYNHDGPFQCKLCHEARTAE
ncbi:hypothetical protein RvY_09814 [Ramazzottius varieornatus]|uniref:tRNA (uracil-O(2)-)-methyltransferase n=1 Tax=Ramazzottius varieornatus TaxID=947166 RepID=A0A1D1VCS7_RAMVA|nr:hypothetical protein RvY_09814 [Ramazzottius varieornatus]